VTTVEDCLLIDFKEIKRREGSIISVEEDRYIPFDIARVYYLYDVPGGSTRGGHAHRVLEQLLVAVMGSFDVILDDGRQQRKINLNRAYFGLYLPTYIWREINNFSSGGVCLVMASRPYEPDDYIRDYEDFRNQKNK
jgi:hypothetical protein